MPATLDLSKIRKSESGDLIPGPVCVFTVSTVDGEEYFGLDGYVTLVVEPGGAGLIAELIQPSKPQGLVVAPIGTGLRINRMPLCSGFRVRVTGAANQRYALTVVPWEYTPGLQTAGESWD